MPWGALREPVSSLTHALGAVTALVFTALLAVTSGAGWPPYLVFGAIIALLYAASAAYHAVRVSPRRIGSNGVG